MKATAAAFPLSAAAMIPGARMFSAKRSSHDFMVSECTSTAAPWMSPALANSSLLPPPTSTTRARLATEMGGAQASETARTRKRVGAVTSTRVAPSLQEMGIRNDSVVTLSAPAARKASTPQPTAFSIAGVPGTRPPTSSVNRRRLSSSAEGFMASAITRSASEAAAEIANSRKTKPRHFVHASFMGRD